MREIFKKYLQDKQPISENDFDLIYCHFSEKSLRKHQYFLQEGDICTKIAFIVQGCLRLYRVDEKGNEFVMQFAFENWWMSDRESGATAKPSNFNIDAIEDTKMLVCDLKIFTDLLKQFPLFGELMSTLQGNSFIAIQKRINAAISYTAEEKYRALMDTQPEILHRIPLKMVASYLGISRETLSRIRSKQL